MKFISIIFTLLFFAQISFPQPSVIDNLASTIATPFYNVYNENVIELLEQFINSHPEVEAIKVHDSMIDKVSIICYKKDGNLVFSFEQDFPEYADLSARRETTDIMKDDKKIGTITLYYMTMLGKELLTEKQSLYLNNKKIIKACIHPNRLPLEKIEDGEYIGMSAEILSIIEDELNIPIKLVQTDSWEESLKYAEARKCDIIPLVSDSKNIKKYMDFTSVYLEAPMVIATQKNIPFINSIEEVADKKLAILRECFYYNDLKEKYPTTKIEIVKDIDSGLQKVENGEVFGYLDNSMVLNYRIQRHYLDTLAISGKLEKECELRIATRNDEPLLNSIFQKAISSIPDSSKDEIYKKWVTAKVEKIKVVDYVLVYNIVAIALLIIIIFLYWNRKIAKAKQELEAAKKEIEKLAAIDKLTGLYNRMKIDELLESEVQRCKRYSNNLVVCILDLDNFKEVNDTFGHLVGDKVLIEFAELGNANIRKTDYFGRWGGEEFLIIMPETDEKGGLAMIEHFRGKIGSHNFSKVGSQTVSIGISAFKTGDTSETLIKRADDALYEAKNSGRNKIVFK